MDPKSIVQGVAIPATYHRRLLLRISVGEPAMIEVAVDRSRRCPGGKGRLGLLIHEEDHARQMAPKCARPREVWQKESGLPLPWDQRDAADIGGMCIAGSAGPARIHRIRLRHVDEALDTHALRRGSTGDRGARAHVRERYRATGPAARDASAPTSSRWTRTHPSCPPSTDLLRRGPRASAALPPCVPQTTRARTRESGTRFVLCTGVKPASRRVISRHGVCSRVRRGVHFSRRSVPESSGPSDAPDRPASPPKPRRWIGTKCQVQGRGGQHRR